MHPRQLGTRVRSEKTLVAGVKAAEGGEEEERGSGEVHDVVRECAGGY